MVLIQGTTLDLYTTTTDKILLTLPEISICSTCLLINSAHLKIKIQAHFKKKSQAVLIPALRRQSAGYQEVPGEPGVQSEFQSSQGDTENSLENPKGKGATHIPCL